MPEPTEYQLRVLRMLVHRNTVEGKSATIRTDIRGSTLNLMAGKGWVRVNGWIVRITAEGRRIARESL